MSSKKIGVLGSGQVAKVLASGFLKHGYDVMIGSRDKTKLEQFKTESNAHIKIGTFEETAGYGDLIVFAVKGTAAEKLAHLKNKVVIDTTNPIADAPPVNGLVQFFTDANSSLMEKLQAAAPDAHFVKAFNSVGNTRMVDPEFKDGRPTMFICGDDAAAKNQVESILTRFGWEVADMGTAAGARAIEPLCILWCIPGFLRNEWTHAFKLLKS
jgi:8-hydroxy-5-deazaflavin:NADPH oxidoreductase